MIKRIDRSVATHAVGTADQARTVAQG